MLHRMIPAENPCAVGNGTVTPYLGARVALVDCKTASMAVHAYFDSMICEKDPSQGRGTDFSAFKTQYEVPQDFPEPVPDVSI